MSVILLPQRWRDQPQRKVSIDHAHPYASALCAAALPCTRQALGNVLSASFNSARSVTRGGVAGSSGTSGQDIVFFPSLAKNLKYTFALTFAGWSHSSNIEMFTPGAAYAPLRYFCVYSGGNRYLKLTMSGSTGTWYDIVFPDEIVPGNVYAAEAVWVPRSEMSLYVNGKRSSVSVSSSDTGINSNSLINRIEQISAASADNRYMSAAFFSGLAGSGELSRDPWGLYAADPVRIYFDIGAGSGAAGVTGENSTQSNAGSSGAIQQMHLAGAENSAQANTSTAGSIQQTHLVSSANSAQSNTSTAGSIQQTQLIGAANSAQSNTSTAGSIQQTHLVGAASSTQSNTGTAGSISTETVAYVSGASSTQDNTCTAGAIQQTHLVSAANSTQSNTGTAGSIQVAGAVAVVGADSTQANTGSAGSIQQTHLVGAANSTCAAVGSAGSILQVHLIICADSTQRATGSAGSIGDVVISDITLAAARQRNTNRASTGRYNVN